MRNVVFYFEKLPMQWMLKSDANCAVDNSGVFQIPLKTPVEIGLVPGWHYLQMSFPYMGRNCGAATAQIYIEPGMRYQVVYTSPVVVSSPGTIAVSVLGPLVPQA